MTSSTRRSIRRTWIFATAMLVLIGLLGCATGRPNGPVFERLAPPDPSSALVYVYRVDSLRGVDGAKVKLDGDNLVALRNGEYVAVVVEPGEHRIGASLYWLGLINRSWNELDFTARGGETLYVKVWAATSPIAGAPDAAQVPGRSDDRGSVGLHMSVTPASEAQSDLRVSRRAQLY